MDSDCPIASWRAAEILAPNPLGHDRDVGVGALLVAGERLAGHGPHAEHAEIVRSDPQNGDALGLRPIGQIRAFAAVGIDGREVERGAPSLYARNAGPGM